MKRIILVLVCIGINAISFGQEIPKEYYVLINKADSLYNNKSFKSSAFCYSEAFRTNGWKGLKNDRCKGAYAWALANYPDSSFYYLNILATENNYRNYSQIATNEDLFSLHHDTRWKTLLEKINQNKINADKKRDFKCSNNDGSEIGKKQNYAEIKSYKLDVNIDVASKIVGVKGIVNIDFHNQNKIDLVLWKNSNIFEIKYKNRNLEYTFDTVSKSPSIYIPNGRRLTILNPGKKTGTQPLYFSYVCDMHDVSGWGRSFTDEWIEIGFYTAWYPVNLDSKNATSNLQISINDQYQVSGSGIIKRKDNFWEMIHSWPIYDNVIIASKQLKHKILHEGNFTIETVYTSFPESDVDSVLSECKNVLNFYRGIFGIQDSAYMKFTICPTEGGGGYGRKNYISLKANKFDIYLVQGIAHEMAHFWWNKADASTWNDWLNEAFAEYSMLLYTKHKYGEEVFNNYIDAYIVNTSQSCPIWGIDRETPEAYSALYEKGSLILYDLEQKIGTDQFYKFLNRLLYSNIKTTNEFLSFVENEISPDIRDWFIFRLKAKNNENL